MPENLPTQCNVTIRCNPIRELVSLWLGQTTKRKLLEDHSVNFAWMGPSEPGWALGSEPGMVQANLDGPKRMTLEIDFLKN